MSLSIEQIEKNYNKHIKIIDTYISDRKEQVKSMIETIGEEYVMAPASGRSWYHNPFVGGYVDHVNRVVEYAVKQMRLFSEMGGTVISSAPRSSAWSRPRRSRTP